jgi:hypothetical protein
VVADKKIAKTVAIVFNCLFIAFFVSYCLRQPYNSLPLYGD